jgi:hypothetical protein
MELVTVNAVLEIINLLKKRFLKFHVNVKEKRSTFLQDSILLLDSDRMKNSFAVLVFLGKKKASEKNTVPSFCVTKAET